MVIGLLSKKLSREKFLRIVLGWIHARVGDRNLCILGRLFTIQMEIGIHTSILECPWLMGSRRHAQESYLDYHLMERSSSVLI